MYSIQGLDNLFPSQHITLFALLRMYDEDFLKLLQEAQDIQDREVENFLDSTNNLLRDQVQVEEYVTNHDLCR